MTRSDTATADLRCPQCGQDIGRRLDDHTPYTCAACGRTFGVLVDHETGEVALCDRSVEDRPEPLGLPRGSIRALIALGVAAACGVRVFTGEDIPGPLASLVLAVVGFYFGFRTKAAMLSDRVYDPAARREMPLFLPAGVVRRVLVLLLLAAGLGLFVRQRLADVPQHLELFIILAGLVAGHLLGRLSERVRIPSFLIHLKGLLGLAAGAVTIALFVAGWDESMPEAAVIALCAAVTFYFGSRS